MRLTWLLPAVIFISSLAAAQQSPPALFFSDLSSGPNSGGETVSGFSGAYVTLYGNLFGSSQGSSAVTWNGQNCLRVVSWGGARLWYQKIVVQVGANCTAGSGNFVVTVGGAASNGLPFSVNSGSIYFVSTSGNDSNNGSFTSPRSEEHTSELQSHSDLHSFPTRRSSDLRRRSVQRASVFCE